VEGLEIGVIGEISPVWNVSAGYTIMNTSVTNGPAVTQAGNEDLSYTPKQAFTSWTTYKLPFGWTVGGGARFVGSLQRGTDSAIGTPTYVQSYWVYDAMASYKISKNMDLQLNAFNLTDKEYVASINKSGYRYIPGTPRTFRLTANIKF
jgi:catecholate siderophore receptor